MKKIYIIIKPLLFLLLSGTLFAKEAPRNFSLSAFLDDSSVIKTVKILTPLELIKPVSITEDCDFDFPSLFHYLWLDIPKEYLNGITIRYI